MGYSYGSWERHRRGDLGMLSGTALKLSALCVLTSHGLFTGTDQGIYQELPLVVRTRPYQMRVHLNRAAEDNFCSRLTSCRSHSEDGITLEEFKIRFGWRIRRLRLERGWSGEDIGTRKGDWKIWQEWETGKKCPKISSWVMVCEVLGIDLDVLLLGIETEGDDLVRASD